MKYTHPEEVHEKDPKKEPKTTFKKFGSSQWNSVEKPVDETTKKVIELSKMFYSGEVKTVTTQEYKICGEETYLACIRDVIFPTNKKVENTNVKKNTNKAMEIINKNNQDKIKKSLDEVIESIDKFNIFDIGFKSPYLEIRLATLMKMILSYIAKNDEEEQSYEVVRATQKILSILQEKKPDEKTEKPTNNNSKKNKKEKKQAKMMQQNVKELVVSKTCMDDLKKLYGRLKTKCNFKFDTLAKKYPKFLLHTQFDNIFGTTAIDLYPSQKEFAEFLRNNDEYLLSLMASIGAGKTTNIVALSAYVSFLRNNQKTESNKDLQVLAVCSISQVREHFGKLLYNSVIPFGIAITDETNTVRIIDNYICKSPKDRITIISDISTAISLLKEDSNYILFVDEPTVGADIPDHPITLAIMRLMTLAPKRTILCSATMPEFDEIPQVVTDFKTKHKNAVVKTIYSNHTMIGCELVKEDNTIFLPHNNCKSVAELNRIINSIEKNAFMHRMYTVKILYLLNDLMIENGVNPNVDLEKIFENMPKVTQTDVQQIAIDFLKLLAKTDDSIVQKVCKPIQRETQSKAVKASDSDEGFAWDSSSDSNEVEQSDVSYTENKLFTTDAYKFLGHCLAVYKNPVNKAKDISTELLKNNTDDASKIIHKFKAETQKYNNSLTMIDKEIKNEEEKTKKLQDFEKNKPQLIFPKEFQVNSYDHLNLFSKDKLATIDKKMIQFENDLTILPLETNVPDWVMKLMFCNVGIFDPTNLLLCPTYNETVSNMASLGQLAFMFSNDSICYGINYPFSSVIVDDEIAKERSIGTIIQLLGRTGRVGVSWKGEGYIGQETEKKIMKFIHGDTTDMIMEAVNMNKAYTKIIAQLKTSVAPETIIFNIQDIVAISDVKPVNKEEQTKIDYDWATFEINSTPVVEQPVIEPIYGDDDTWELLCEVIETKTSNNSPSRAETSNNWKTDKKNNSPKKKSPPKQSNDGWRTQKK